MVVKLAVTPERDEPKMSKMMNPQIEVVRFDAEDVIATSGTPAHMMIGAPEAPDNRLIYNDNGTRHEEIEHFYITKIDDNGEYYGYFYIPGTGEARPGQGSRYASSWFSEGVTPEVGKYYYFDYVTELGGDRFFPCSN